MSIRTIIVDDEPGAQKVLGNYISRHPEIELVGTFLDAISAHSFLKKNHVDLILLDITMPEVDGFTFLRMLPRPPLVVITTAHPEFAMESYNYNAVDYLKKPIPYERFALALAKVVSRNNQPALPKPLSDHINLKIDGQWKPVFFDKLKYFRSYGNYIQVVTSAKTYLTHITTKDVEDNLPKELFIRIHKSYIVNRTMIDRVTETNVVIGEIKLPIGKTFKKYVSDSTANLSKKS